MDVTARPGRVNGFAHTTQGRAPPGSALAAAAGEGYMIAMILALPFARSADPLRPWLGLVLAVSIGALIVALLGQFVFGLAPCMLCLYARVPYLAAAVIGAAGLLLPLRHRQRRRLLALAGLVFAASAVLAVFQVGVEQGWWVSNLPGCAGRPAGVFDPADLRAGLLTPVRACTDVDFRLGGLSLAGWNGLASTMLAAGCLGLAGGLADRSGR